jgi:hypothetical protein
VWVGRSAVYLTIFAICTDYISYGRTITNKGGGKDVEGSDCGLFLRYHDNI